MAVKVLIFVISLVPKIVLNKDPSDCKKLSLSLGGEHEMLSASSRSNAQSRDL